MKLPGGYIGAAHCPATQLTGYRLSPKTSQILARRAGQGLDLEPTCLETRSWPGTLQLLTHSSTSHACRPKTCPTLPNQKAHDARCAASRWPNLKSPTANQRPRSSLRHGRASGKRGKQAGRASWCTELGISGFSGFMFRACWLTVKTLTWHLAALRWTFLRDWLSIALAAEAPGTGAASSPVSLSRAFLKPLTN
jgi:hypothetical protein